MARSRSTTTDLMKSEEFVEIALSSIEREIEATRDRLRRLSDVADQLRQRRSTSSPAPTAAATVAEVLGATPRRRRKHNMSAEARKRLSERMRKRWDDYRKNKAKASKGK